MANTYKFDAPGGHGHYDAETVDGMKRNRHDFPGGDNRPGRESERAKPAPADYVRCGGCGGMVKPPCILCGLK